MPYSLAPLYAIDPGLWDSMSQTRRPDTTGRLP